MEFWVIVLMAFILENREEADSDFLGESWMGSEEEATSLS